MAESSDIPTQPTNSPGLPRGGLVYLGLIACVFLVFWPVLTFEFLGWDDFETISKNPLLNPPRLESLIQAWTRPFMHLWVPLTSTTWWFIAWISGIVHADGSLDPAFFHGANLILHAFSTCIVFALLLLLIRHRNSALLGALLFAVHPVQVETVAWASGLKDLLCGLLMLLAIWMYVLSTDADSPQSHFRRRVKYATALFAYCLAMLAKPSAMAAPLICVCLDYFRNVRPRQSIARLIPWFALAIPCMIWTREVQFQPASQPLLVRIGVAMDSLAFYLFKLIAPIHHAADYGRRPKAILDSGAIYFTWLLPAAVIAFAWLIRKRSPVVPASLGVFCAAVAPVSGIVPFDFQHYSTVADHYLYVAMLGAALLAAWGISRTPSKTTTRVAALLLVALGARSWVQTWNWRDSPTFFTHILEVNPNSWFANRNIAAALVDAGHPQEAMEYLRTALAANPEYAKNYITLGVAYMSMRQPDRAIQAWERALQLDPDNAVIHTNIAATLAEQGQFEQARAHLVQALQIDPNDSQAHLNLGTLLAQTNQPEAAIAELRLATRLAPRDPRARTNLGFVLLGRGDASGAIREFSIALSIDPSSRAAAEGMAQAKAKLAP